MIRKTIALLSIIPLLGGCGFNSNNDINSYDELLINAIDNADFHTLLHIFPKSTRFGTPTNFAYKKMDDIFNGSYFFYLVMEYDEVNFNNELTRLSEVKAHFPNGEYKHVIHFEEQSLYLTINRDKRYEYAIYDKERLEIAYVSNQLFSWQSARVDSRHSLPNVTIPADLDDGDNSYNLYYYYSYEPDGMGGEIYIGMATDD